MTNFAVIFDFTGDAIVDYLWLDIVTYIVLSISIILLVVTQIVSHNYQRLVLAITYSKEKGLIKIRRFIIDVLLEIIFNFYFFSKIEPKVIFPKKD